jgi:hypothetical protein
MKSTRLIGAGLIGAGVIVMIAGIIFALQGVGVIGGSFMSGTSLWAILGPLIALAGLAMSAFGLWHLRTAGRRA